MDLSEENIKRLSVYGSGEYAEACANWHKYAHEGGPSTFSFASLKRVRDTWAERVQTEWKVCRKHGLDCTRHQVNTYHQAQLVHYHVGLTFFTRELQPEKRPDEEKTA